MGSDSIFPCFFGHTTTQHAPVCRKWSLTPFLISLTLVLAAAGCQYYEEYRSMKGDADIKEETAEMRKAYRLCLQKYEGDSAAQNTNCAPYAQAVQDMERRSPPPK